MSETSGLATATLEASRAQPGETIEPSPPEPTPSTGPPALETALATLTLRLESGLEALRGELAEKLRYDRFKEEQIERLHGELQSHKSDLMRRLNEPLLLGLIKLHDHLGQLLGNLRARSLDELSPERLLAHLDDFRDDVEILLARHGVEPFSTLEPVFDPRRQIAVGRVAAPGPELAGTIAVRVRPGFEQGSQLLQKERVTVFVSTPSSASAEGELQ